MFSKTIINANCFKTVYKRKKCTGLLKRGIKSLYKNYPYKVTNYNEEVNLFLGMRYGNSGIQPCHNNCNSVCKTSDNMCSGLLGYQHIDFEGADLYIIMCIYSVDFHLIIYNYSKKTLLAWRLMLYNLKFRYIIKQEHKLNKLLHALCSCPFNSTY